MQRHAAGVDDRLEHDVVFAVNFVHLFGDLVQDLAPQLLAFHVGSPGHDHEFYVAGEEMLDDGLELAFAFAAVACAVVAVNKNRFVGRQAFYPVIKLAYPDGVRHGHLHLDHFETDDDHGEERVEDPGIAELDPVPKRAFFVFRSHN